MIESWHILSVTVGLMYLIASYDFADSLLRRYRIKYVNEWRLALIIFLLGPGAWLLYVAYQIGRIRTWHIKWLLDWMENSGD